MSTHPLNIELFTHLISDFEACQYRVLAGLKEVSEDFKKNKIYPHLTHLIDLHRSLCDILNSLQNIHSEFPKRIKKIDFVNQEIEYKIVFQPDSDLRKVEDLIEWGLPYVKAKIEEGKAIYEFVDEELKLEEVGIIPSYTDEGYFFVPDNEESKLLLFQYEVTVFKSAEDDYRALKTAFLKALKQGMAQLSPNSIKLELVNENKTLPNPATFAFNTDLYFPFRETIFPVTKRKLLRQLCN